MHINSLIAGVGGSIGILMTIINVAVAIGVFFDATTLARKEPTSLRILPPILWALVCLFGGVPALALYWVANYSVWSK